MKKFDQNNTKVINQIKRMRLVSNLIIAISKDGIVLEREIDCFKYRWFRLDNNREWYIGRH